MRSAAFTSACALTLMLVAAGGASAAEPSASAATSTGASTAPATIPHTVLAGESCRSISKQFWNNDPKAIDKFHAVNPQLLGPVHHLVPGQIVTVLAPPPDARLTFLKPDVFKRVKKQPDWLSAARGDDLFRLDEVNTAKGAGAEVTFRDDSSVQLDENALIVIYGDQAPAPKQQKSGALELVQGDASVNLSALRGEKPLQVKTPAAMVAFTSGAKTGVGVDAAKMSRVAVYSGKAEVSASGKQVQVHRGFGTRVEQGKAPEPPTPLPEAPQWSTDTVLLAWSFANRPAAPQLAWKETARAAVYRVQVARDAGFYDRAIDTAVKAGEPLQIAKALPVGALYARVRAVDAKGLPGPASETLRVLVVSVRASAEVPAIGELALRATGQLTLTIDGPQGVQLAVGKGAAQDLPQGELSVRDVGATEVVVSAQGAKPLRLPIAIDAPSAAVQIAPAAGDSLQHAVSIELRDAAGEPFTSQAITARTSDGHALPLTFDGATARTMLQEPAEGSTRVEALWGERVIGSAEVAARMKSPPPPPAPVLPPGKHAGVLGGTNATGAATPLPTAFIDPGLSVALRLQPELGATAQRNQVFAGGLDVEGGTDRYTFSLGLNAQSAPALTDSGAKVWPALGVRDAIFTQDQVSLVLGGDVSFGLGSSADGLRLPLLRLYLALGIELGPLSLSTTQALAPSDSGSGTGWDGSVVGAWHAKPWLDVIAEVGGASGGTCPIDCTAFAAGAGVRGRHGAFEAGASLRTGLYPAGREFWGAPALVFTLGWRGFDAWGKQPPAPQ